MILHPPSGCQGAGGICLAAAGPGRYTLRAADGRRRRRAGPSRRCARSEEGMEVRQGPVILAVCLGMLLAALDATIVGTAMPTVAASLGGLPLYAWVFSIYMLAATASMPLFGKLSDLHGRRRLFLAAIGIFTAGSALCGAVASMPQLIGIRPVS